jgi:anthranilate synthase component 2
MILMIDNYDSFTYNLVQYLGELGAEVCVYRNDRISLQEIETLALSHIVISPGPCTPDQAGVSVDVVNAFAGRVPILGVCLGHQSVGQAFGGKIVHAQVLMHGKTSMIYHHGEGLFTGMTNPFQATRYHSLVIDPATLPDCMEVTAWTEEGEIMAVRHLKQPVYGVQFHPESISTEYGHELLNNFLQAADG